MNNAIPLIVLLSLILLAIPAYAAPTENVTPISNPGKLMPAHGTVSIQPAKKWEDALAAGNGIMGALLYGDPSKDTMIVDHCKLWLPLGSMEIVPDIGKYLVEWRRIIGEKGYGAGQQFFEEKAKEQGWNGKLTWTDPFHPGFFLMIDQPQTGPATDYARVENFATGEVSVQWRTSQGEFSRRLIVSKPDNVIAMQITGQNGKVSLHLEMGKIDNSLIESSISYTKNWITCHNIYVNGKGGYDGVIHVIARGGSQSSDGSSLAIKNANSVLLLVRLLPWKTPLTSNSEAWPYSPNNPDFHQKRQVSNQSVQLAGMTYQTEWMREQKRSLQNLPAHYKTLLQRQEKAWGAIYNRVSINLGGSAKERKMPSETLLDLAQKEKRAPKALLERMYDAGRYVFMCSAGPQTPPNLFGIWTGTWSPAWSGDYTTDTNLQLDVECAYSANMAECMQGYFNLWDSFLPDFQTTARNLYGCRGIMTGSRASNIGLGLHWGNGWPGEMWTPGASWIAHWYYDYFRYTGDRKFLRDGAIPFMEQCALFWEDFLKGTEDANGKYTFRPSFSAENGWGDDTSQDIEITHQLFTNLIQGCEILGIKKREVAHWKMMLAKMPPLLINSEGQLKEWSNPPQGEHNNHRHLMHLYGAFDGQQFAIDTDPTLFAAARVALMNRLKASTEEATHGLMQQALAGAELGMGNVAFERLQKLAVLRSIYPNMVDGHYPGPDILCDDGNGATPEIIDRMVAQSKLGSLSLLPAIPNALPKGALKGTCARGDILLNKIEWDTKAGRILAVITSGINQKITLVMPPNVEVDRLTVNGKSVKAIRTGVETVGCLLNLPKGKRITIDAKFHPGNYRQTNSS